MQSLPSGIPADVMGNAEYQRIFGEKFSAERAYAEDNDTKMDGKWRSGVERKVLKDFQIEQFKKKKTLLEMLLELLKQLAPQVGILVLTELKNQFEATATERPL